MNYEKNNKTMATIKSYTSLEQSKKLAEILPLESADMYYTGHLSIINPKEWEYGDTPRIRGKYISFDNKRIFYPCWSLTSLLGVLIYPRIEQNYMGKWVCRVEQQDTTYLWEDSNPVDACYEVIIRLHELNLL